MKRMAWFGVLFCAGFLLSGIDLVLKDKAIVNENVIRLSDVAAILQPSNGAYADLILAAALDPGQIQVLSAAEITSKLKGNGCSVVNLSGAKAVHVERHGRKVEAAFFIDKIRDYLMRNSLWDEGVKISVPAAKAVIVPEKDVDWQLIPVPGEDAFGHVLFRVRGIADGSEIYNNWLTARVTVEKMVALTIRPLEKAEAIQAADIHWEKREITPFMRKAIFNPDDIVGAKTSRYIPVHTIISADMLTTSILVKRGEPARLQAVLKEIVAVSTVTPMADGRLGDRIRVMTQQSKKIIMATVSGRNELQMEIQ